MTSKHSIYYFHCFIITGLTSFRLINISFFFILTRDFERSSMARWRKRIFWSPANNLIYLYRVYLHHLSAYLGNSRKREKDEGRKFKQPEQLEYEMHALFVTSWSGCMSRCPQRVTKNLEHHVPKSGQKEFFLRICGLLIRIFFIKLITWSRENIVDHFWFKTLL